MNHLNILHIAVHMKVDVVAKFCSVKIPQVSLKLGFIPSKQAATRNFPGQGRFCGVRARR